MNQQPDLSRREAAVLLAVSESTIHRLIQSGQLRSYKLGSAKASTVRICRESIEALRAGMSNEVRDAS